MRLNLLTACGEVGIYGMMQNEIVNIQRLKRAKWLE